MLDGKNIFITGGTGSFGHSFIKILNASYNVGSITVYSRDEMKQWDMKNKTDYKNVNFVIGDVRDRNRLIDTMRGIM